VDIDRERNKFDSKRNQTKPNEIKPIYQLTNRQTQQDINKTMPRRNQEAEDEAFAQALQDEYRRDLIRRQEERSERDDGISSPRAERDNRDSNRDGRRNRSTNDSGKRKKKKKDEKGGKREKKKSKSRKKSRDGETTGSENPKQRRAPPVPVPIPVPLPPPLLPTYNQQYSAAPTLHTHDDEAYARQVEAELRSEEETERRRARRARKQKRKVAAQEAESLRSAEVTDHRGGVPKTASFQDSNASDITAPSTDDDEVVAKRIQQELADAEYAERISNLEREETASREVVQTIQRQQQLQLQQMQEAPQKSCIRRWTPLVVCLAIAITLPLLYVFDVFDLSDITDLQDNLQDILGDIFEDDWNGNVGPASNMTFVEYKGILVPRLPSDAIAWANIGSGLRLDILNACSDDWTPILSTAIANWENGDPVKSLSLYMSKVAYDKNCISVDGKMKVCNGDYGDTRWRGLNEVMMTVRQNTIVTSTAKLNEFYLDYEGSAQKLYTACHEIGHGFGLPHWDEDFGNKDLGNCMDYTYNPAENSTPDKSNFLYLAQLYGGQQVSSKAELTAADVRAMIDDRLEETQEITTQKVDGIRNLFGIGGSSQKIRGGVHIATIPLSESRLKIDHTIPGGPTPTRRLLHADESTEIHVYESPDYPGLRIYQHFLLVGDEEYN